jgi:hypothetical protein
MRLTRSLFTILHLMVAVAVIAGLVTNPGRSGRSGFVRVSPTPSTSAGRVSGPFYNPNGALQMGEGWRYQNED